MSEPAVSILVPTLDEEAHVRGAVEAMLAQRIRGGLEILVVDGRSEDRTRALVDELASDHSEIRLLDNPARRTPSALNIGLEAASGDYVVRMDAHTYYPPDYVARGVARLERGDVDWVSGPQVAHGDGRWSRRIAMALTSRLGVGGASFRSITAEIDTDTGFTGVWRRATLLAHGGWDEGWPVNQDGELAARVRKAGGRIVCIPEMAASYVPRDTLRGLARQYWRYGQYRVKTSRRHPDSMRRSHVLPPALVLTALSAPFLPAWAGRPARAALASYAAALALESARCGRASGASALDGLGLPLVFATMHIGWGAGFLVGCIRFGAPTAAVASLPLRR